MTRELLFYIMEMLNGVIILECIEKMADFFAARVDMYDEHMLEDVEGCKEGYVLIADYVPSKTQRLLDLGCGTGLELESIFEKLPDLYVTGIDLCRDMLSRLEAKYSGKSLNLICGDYFSVPFEPGFDCAISFQTMHHFRRDKKLILYKKICQALLPDGVYIECDYMVSTQAEEDRWLFENRRIREAMGIDEDELYHYDTPCSVENQVRLLTAAGFSSVEMVMRIENTTMLVARK